MKIIEVGSVSKKIKCPDCASKLEYEPIDVECEESEDGTAVQSIYCPVCGKKISLNLASSFPLSILKRGE